MIALRSWLIRLLIVLSLVGVVAYSHHVEASSQTKTKMLAGGVLVQIDKLVIPVIAIEGGEIRLVNESVQSPVFPRTVTESGKLSRILTPISIVVSANYLTLLRDVFPEMAGGTGGNHTITVFELSTNGQLISSTAYENCSLAEIMVSGLNVSSAQSATAELKLVAGKLTRKDSASVPAITPPKTQNIRGSNFRVEIDGVDTRGVAVVSPIRIQMQNRALQQNRAVADCTFSVSLSFRSSWISWFDKSDVKFQGTISLLDSANNRVFRIMFSQIFPIEYKKSLRGGQEVSMFAFQTAIREAKMDL